MLRTAQVALLAAVFIIITLVVDSSNAVVVAKLRSRFRPEHPGRRLAHTSSMVYGGLAALAAAAWASGSTAHESGVVRSGEGGILPNLVKKA